ncbi:hypothetical protein A2643_01580 [Candidatus Nomurabacteria bacterium RIFCSPHIGHO2_01_FULL_39_220]|uniref:RiboL-PSP-HEPN domain-containing protein n=1 Tax=Candidatus Nomurabacteria bacterium RIFCSPLOWO2_02_FULL_40_67 TaxID=1801787 RepID=A0A1F6Y5C8_9BACT|nr:MAG: hypothetical protein A2W12_02315 [Candidatus Nomurabacteria bacterium RBG_16_40_11]OGI69947.1 MAG: hypothetical protein A2643_01580 [Candidatus Nomurabacteria bacterium RIFCSPHIGHO2_01_FULL_39_220]OGI73418.1 MAG: hypothetical protein A2W56_00980 [Candidatus Nomurabacteria bacterium RIFCSPHIGHO2_02_41_18]OGI78519.1 MAG: hypothetical protein A3C65_02695 [Candidatus Nomurabacteria bacterium RIFCSPHIGHO2_02_FULL_41_150]OGI81553.1 MAG: hypothetical protein A3E03_01960 [Candidatus Nomurabacte
METSNNNILGDSVLGSNWFNPDYLFNQGIKFFHDAFNITINPDVISLYHTILMLFALFFLTIISYASIRLFEIRAKERKHLGHEIAEYAHYQTERVKKRVEGDSGSKNERWGKTLGYLFSQHPSDWKLAIIEADSMLESLMDQLGFKGVALGDKLKSADQDKFHSLTSAWEVHTIRNRIAHEGAAFSMSQHEAKRVIAIYEHIFRDFGFI